MPKQWLWPLRLTSSFPAPTFAGAGSRESSGVEHPTTLCPRVRGDDDGRGSCRPVRPLQAQGNQVEYRASVDRDAGSADDDHATAERQASRKVLDKGRGCPVAKAHRDLVTCSRKSVARHRASRGTLIANATSRARRILDVGADSAPDSPSGRDDAALGARRPATKVRRLACIRVRVTRRFIGKRRRCCAHNISSLVAHACDRRRDREHDRNGCPDRQHRDGDSGNPCRAAEWWFEACACHDGHLFNDSPGLSRPRHAA